MVGIPSGGKMSRAIFCQAIDAPRTTATIATSTVNGRRKAGETRFMNQCREWRHLLAPKSKIIEHGHAVCFRPNAHRPALLEGVVLPFQSGFAIECHLENVSGKIHPQRVPL